MDGKINIGRAVCLTLMLLLTVNQMVAQTRWHDPMDEAAPVIQGRWWSAEIGKSYNRLPDRAKSLVRDKVWSLSTNTAGEFIEFYTDAPEITIELLTGGGKSLPNLLPIAKSGVDLYRMESDGRLHYCACPGNFGFGSAAADTTRFHYTGLSYPDGSDNGLKYRLFLPLYNDVQWLSVGVPKGSSFTFVEAKEESPVVIYGTSITQGASASRPGMAWTNIIQRRTGLPIVNLGFSGNGLMEKELFELMAEIPARMFVIDCIANLEGGASKVIRERLTAGVKLLRSVSDAPILLAETAGRMYSHTSDRSDKNVDVANAELRSTYEALCAEGIAGLYYLSKEEIGLDEDAQTDGVHASDLGMVQYADAFQAKIEEAIGLFVEE